VKNEEPKWAGWLLGEREALPLEKRVLNALLLASGVLATLLLVEALVFGYANALVLASIVAVAYWALYLAGKSVADRRWPLCIYMTISGAVIVADWFLVGGHTGVSLVALVTIAGAIPLVTRREQLRPGTWFFLGFYLLLCVTTALYWERVPIPSVSRTALLVQLFEAGIFLSCLYVVAYLAIGSYRREKEIISELNAVLADKNESLERTNRELQSALDEIELLREILPTCSYCRKIRPKDIGPREARSWVAMESYITAQYKAEFSHGICPECVREQFGEEMFRKVYAEMPPADPDLLSDDTPT